MIAPALTLTEYLDSIYVTSRDLGADSVYQLRRSCRVLAEWIGYDVPLVDVNELLLCRWLVAMQGKYAAATLRKMRGDVLGIVADAFDSGMGPEVRSRRVRKVKVPPPNPQAWTLEEVGRLVDAARGLPGKTKTGTPRSVYFEAVVRTAWDTGFRIGDLQRITLADVTASGLVVIRQRKTRDLVTAQLETPTFELLMSIGQHEPLAWRGAKRMLYYWWRKVKAKANVTSYGAFQKIRVSAATDVAARDRGAMTAFLGHASDRADRHYLDVRMLPPPEIRPRPLPTR